MTTGDKDESLGDAFYLSQRVDFPGAAWCVASNHLMLLKVNHQKWR